jgi:hypothetical protein
MKAHPEFAAILLLGVMSAVFAAEASPRCSSVFDDSQRLACYDAQFGKPRRPDAAQPASHAAPVPVAVAPVSPTAPTAPATPMPRVELITSRVTAVNRIAGDRFLFTLDNGQAWTQLERDPNVQVEVGDTVKIRRAMLGSWMLETRDGVRTRVRSAQ